MGPGPSGVGARSRGGRAIRTLTSRQRAHLRSLAHRLKPVVQIGADGVSATAVDAVREAFNTRELLKVKVLESAPLSARQAADEIARHLPDSHIPQVIGRTVVVYRPFPEKPAISLPD